MIHAWLQWKWYTCYPSLQLKTNATQAELTHAIIIIILILIMPWLYYVVVCEYIWFRFMVRQPKFGNIISEDSELSRVAPWCGKGKNWKDVWLTGDLRVFDYVLLTDINIPFGISSCKHRFRNNLNISLCVFEYTTFCYQ